MAVRLVRFERRYSSRTITKLTPDHQRRDDRDALGAVSPGSILLNLREVKELRAIASNLLPIVACRSYSPLWMPQWHPPPPGAGDNQVTTRVALLSRDQIAELSDETRDVVSYRKSGLSLNHIVGCPLDCAYCIRHTYGLWDQRVPRALMPDAQAVEELVNHRYFQPHVTPVQVFNRATDPFLPQVRPHTFAALEDLDGRGLTNHVLVITRHQMKPDDIDRLNQLRHLKVTLLFTYSGIENKDIEPYPSSVAATSLKLMSEPSQRRYQRRARGVH